MSLPETSKLTEALAKVQGKLPEITKAKTADAGQYSYSYADLAAVTKAVVPLLAQAGLAWACRPTLTDRGFVLAYELRHVSGESITGEYPLPEKGSPQQMGSAITYGRRYALCSVTGVAPDSDDDDAKAASHRSNDADRHAQSYARALALRDRALAAKSREELAGVWKDAGPEGLAVAVPNESGDDEQLGAIVQRLGDQFPAADPTTGEEASDV